MGQAGRTAFIKALGRPDEERRSAEAGAAREMIYHGRGEHKGELAVQLDGRGVVIEVKELLTVAMPRTALYHELGQEATTAHYSFTKCDGLKRDASGPLELTLYPRQGVALWPERRGYDFAAILYLARAPERMAGGCGK